jgi:uncharacterized membrane protein
MFDAFKAVFWSFFGVRKQADYDSDEKKLKLKHVIFAGIVSVLALIFGLFLLVKMIVK